MKLLIFNVDGTIKKAQSTIKSYADKGWLILGKSNNRDWDGRKANLEINIKRQQINLNLCPYLNQIFITPTNDECLGIYKIYSYQFNHFKFTNGQIISINNFYEQWDSNGFLSPNTGIIEVVKLIYDSCSEFLFIGDNFNDHLCAKNANVDFQWFQDWIKLNQ